MFLIVLGVVCGEFKTAEITYSQPSSLLWMLARVKIFETAYYRDGADAYEMIKLFADEQEGIPSSVNWHDTDVYSGGQRPPAEALVIS